MSFSKPLATKEAEASSSSSSSSCSSSSPFNNPEAREAEACKHRAEELFKERKIDSALCVIERARSKNPNLADLNSHFACYVVHKLAAKKKCWYAVLGIRDAGAGVGAIKRRYEAMSQLFQSRDCSTVAAENAIKLINEAWGVLSDPKRREAYDMLMGYNNSSVQSENRSNVSNNNVVVQLEGHQNVENCNKPSISERIRRNSTPSAAAGSSSSPQPPSCFLHKTKKVIIIKRNGQNTGNTGDKVIIITRKPATKI